MKMGKRVISLLISAVMASSLLAACGGANSSRQEPPIEEKPLGCAHAPVTDAMVEPTCTQEGKTAGSHCDKCGEVFKAQEAVLAKGHQWQDATCRAPKTCRVCDATEGEVAEHNFGQWQVIKQATEESAGKEQRRCLTCAFTETKDIPPLTHEHNFIGIWQRDENYHWRTCVCGQESEALSHNFSPWDVTVPSTCLAAGWQQRVCKDCRQMQTEAAPLAEHKWVGGVCTECQNRKPSEGLELSPNDENAQSYSVSGLGTCTDREIVLPFLYEGKPVTAVSSYAFIQCGEIKSVYLPESITKIGNNAFSDCVCLEKVTLSQTIAEVGAQAFSGCTALTGMELPESVRLLGNGVFSECTALKEVKLPSGIDKIGDWMFWQCTSLTKCEIPFGVKVIGQGAFDGCTLLSGITIPASVFEIGEGAFRDCASITSITIPGGISEVGDSVFFGCVSLKSVEIHDGVTKIGTSSFRGCSSFLQIKIPDSVTEIASYAFMDCTALKTISLPDGILRLGAMAFENTAYFKDDNNWEGNILYVGRYLADVKDNFANKYVIKEGTLGIADHSFYYCKYFSSIEIPSSVISIGSQAFYACDALREIKISEGIRYIGSSAFEGTKYYKTESNREDGVLYLGRYLLDVDPSCQGIVTVKQGTVCIASNAFAACEEITHVKLPQGVKYIGENAFGGCLRLLSVTLPSSLICIERYAFSSCVALSSLQLPSKLQKIGSHAFVGCTGLDTVHIPESVLEMGDMVFAGSSVKTIFTEEKNQPAGWDMNWNAGCDAEVKRGVDILIPSPV